ncbi:MAG: fold metallo-hydrolase [Acidimicrobiales bacterium]|nr:fold metallo-hydrolase [Acidimicrobiales bacterium]
MAQRWRVGDVEITCVTEVAFDVPASVLVRDFDGDALSDELSILQPDYLTDTMLLRIAIQTFAIRSGGRRVLVDTCFGNDHQLPYFSDLRTDTLRPCARRASTRRTSTRWCAHPGHVSVRVESRSEVALITGDMIHHPVQIVRHEWASVPDSEPARSVQSGSIWPSPATFVPRSIISS